jgi:hypothetical protein
MQVMWSSELDNNDTDGSGAELGDEHELNLALMIRVEEGPSTIDRDGIIASKNISYNKTIELLKKKTMSKN